MQEIALEDVYQLMEPGPVVLLITCNEGQPNVMTMSWHMMVDFVPPLAACVVSRRNLSFTALRQSGQCVIGIPGVELAQKVVDIGNCSGRDVDKFARYGLTPSAPKKVAVPLIKECFVNLECKIKDPRLIEDYDLLVLEVVAAWRDPERKTCKTFYHQGYGSFVVDGQAISLASRMP